MGEDQDKQLSAEELSVQLAAEKEAKLMALADLENYRRRVEREKQDLVILSNLSIFKAIADTIDDFERLVEDLDKVNEEDKVDAFKPILDKTKGILKDYGIDEIKVEIGQKMDPAIMEALGTVAVDSEEKSNTVQHIAQKGYRMTGKDIVVRHARVIIGKFN